MKKNKCIKCGKTTRFSIRYDIDCSPIWVYKKCEEEVRLALVMLQLNKEEAKRFTKGWYQQIT